MNDPTRKKCICDWGDFCKKAFDVLNENLEEGHHWRGNYFSCVPVEKSKNTIAFATALYNIFNRGKFVLNKKLFIARYHFSTALLKNHPGHRNKFLSRSEVRALDNDNSTVHCGYEIRKFSVFYLLDSGVKSDKEIFIGAPIVPKSYVKGVVESYYSKRPPIPLESFSTPTKKLKKKLSFLPLDGLNGYETSNENHLVYKTTKSIHSGLVKYFNQSKNIHDFRSHDFVQRAINDIIFQVKRCADYPYMFELEKGKVLHLCTQPSSINCELFKILMRPTERRICDACWQNQYSEERRNNRKQMDSGNRTSSSSRVNISHLSPNSLKLRYSQSKGDNKVLKQQVGRLRLVLKDVKETQKVSVENENVVQLIEEAFKHITNVYDRNKLKEQIIFALLDNKIDQQKIDKSEIQIFASRVCNLLDAESKKNQKKDKRITFDYRIKRLALSHYLQFGKTSYNQLRESSLEIYPSPRTNETSLSVLRGGSGSHVAKFASQFADIIESKNNKSNGKIVAIQLLFDEIKIKCGVAKYEKINIWFLKLCERCFEE